MGNKRLGDVTSLIARGIAPIYDDLSRCKVLNQKCIRGHRVDTKLSRGQSRAVPKEKLVRKGDILINSTGQGTLGRVGQVHSDITNFAVDSHVTIVRPNKYPPYLGEVAKYLEAQFQAAGVGSTGQTELSRERIASVKFVYPPDKVVSSFSTCSGLINQLASRLMDSSSNLRTTRDLLLPKLVSGEISIEATKDDCFPLAEGIRDFKALKPNTPRRFKNVREEKTQ